MTENEQKYFDEVVAVLKAKGNIGFMDRPRLARLGTSLGVSVERALELDGEAKKFLKQEGARLAEEERLRKEQEAAAEERRKAEEARIRAEREAAEAEERRRKDEEKRKKAEEAAEELRLKRERQLEKAKAQAARRRQAAATTDKPAETTADSQSARGVGHRQEKAETTDSKKKYRPGVVNWCVMAFTFLAMIWVFWSGHWMAGILLSIFPILALCACEQGSDDESDFAPWRWLAAAGVYGLACYAGVSGRWFVAAVLECCVLIPLVAGNTK